MNKRHCSEFDLFKKPERLLDYYFRIRGILLSDTERMGIIECLGTRTGIQTAESFLCPLNRDVTRREYNCSDYDFLKDHNYGRLILHYALKGGSEKFAEEKGKDFFFFKYRDFLIRIYRRRRVIYEN